MTNTPFVGTSSALSASWRSSRIGRIRPVKAFFDDAGWKRLKADPAYADIVSKVTAVFLRPLPASQI